MAARQLRIAASLLAVVFAFSACGGSGGGGGGGLPTTAPTAGPSSSPGSTSSSTAFTCPSSETSIDGATGATTASVSRRLARSVHSSTQSTATGLLAVTYESSAVLSPKTTIDAHVTAAGAQLISQLAFSAIGRATRVYAVSPANLAAAESAAKTQPGVVSAEAVGVRSALSVTTPYFPQDPFFVGQAGSIAPLYETAATQGQWDMHVIGLQDAFAYSQANNGSGVTNAGALGSPTVKLAIVDTGEDVTHPDLKGTTIARSECFITNENGTQSTGTYVTDPDGHGTDVTGIAAKNNANDFGFAGTGGNVSLMLYRVFPTPDDTCATGGSAANNDARCGADTVDIASAINDAVSNGANVINLSLGGGTCSNGVDPDSTEGAAISNALAHNVIVVAASGNSGGEGVTAPACDTGVIAVGASAYNDGQPNGSGYSGGNTEYVASYSQYGATNTPNSTSSWGLVAPGGDAASDSDQDDLHWISNIWTSTPYDANYAGSYCASGTPDSPDVFGETGNCLTFVDGTSMSSAHVAGAAALILSASSAYGTPAAMFKLLCQTADNINATGQGCGRLNIYRAMATAVDDPNPPT